MLGSLENPTLPPENVGTVPMTVRGNNAMGAGDQQGRPDEQIGHYIAGVVDGEGSFHVAVQRNPTTRLKWQVIPEFHISQNDGNQHVLALIRDVLGCGYIKPNHPRRPRDPVGLKQILTVAFSINQGEWRRRKSLEPHFDPLHPLETLFQTPERAK